MPSSWMWRAAAGPSMATASVMLTVLSGHTVVHSESTNATTTALPRNWRSETCEPNWLVSVKPGAAVPGRVVPGSTSGLEAAWLPSTVPGTCGCGLEPDLEAITAMGIAASTRVVPSTTPMTSRLAPGGPVACQSGPKVPCADAHQTGYLMACSCVPKCCWTSASVPPRPGWRTWPGPAPC